MNTFLWWLMLGGLIDWLEEKPDDYDPYGDNDEDDERR